MTPDFTEFSERIETSMSLTKTQNTLIFAWNGGSYIGAQAYNTIDLTNIDKISGSIITGNSYTINDSKFYIYVGIVDTSVNLATTQIAQNVSLLLVRDEFHVRNSTYNFEIDVASMTGNYQIVISCPGWYATIQDVVYTESLPTFFVAYNSNGGVGSMANQSIYIDEPTALSLNTFTRENYVFTGWATSSTGSVVYTDGQTVTNIAEADQTITLYAVWQKAPLSISLQTNSSENNKVDKDITTISTVTGTLRAECSIIDPVIIFALDLVDFVECNYITIPAFRRSYFVNNIRSIRNGLVEMSCHVDVLSSFKNEIRANSAIIHKSENDWNLYLNDGSLKTYQNALIYTHSFPSGFAGQSFVLALAGE